MKKTGKSTSERKDFAESVKAKNPAYFALLKTKGDSKKINAIIARADKQAEKPKKSGKTHKQIVAEITEQNRRYYGCYGDQGSAVKFAQKVKAQNPAYFAMLEKKGDFKKINEIIARARSAEEPQRRIEITLPAKKKNQSADEKRDSAQIPTGFQNILRSQIAAKKQIEAAIQQEPSMPHNYEGGILSADTISPRGSNTQEAECSYTCPHCSGEMTYAKNDKWMDSQCPHCQKPIILGRQWTKQIRANPETENLQTRDTSKGILDKLSCICPHCNLEMTFAPVYEGMVSKCLYCQKPIIFGCKSKASGLFRKILFRKICGFIFGGCLILSIPVMIVVATMQILDAPHYTHDPLPTYETPNYTPSASSSQPAMTGKAADSSYSISSDRAEKYLGSAAQEEMRDYLKSQGQPASDSDIDYALKVNERLEHYNGQ